MRQFDSNTDYFKLAHSPNVTPSGTQLVNAPWAWAGLASAGTSLAQAGALQTRTNQPPVQN
ncbi:MAG: hypothetical protein ACRC0L_00345, partial [Angustibacter sp.]